MYSRALSHIPTGTSLSGERATSVEFDEKLIAAIDRALRIAAAGLTHNVADQEDAVQDAWWLLVKRPDTDPVPRNWPAFARNVLRNNYFSGLRRSQRESKAFASIAPEGLMSESVEHPILSQRREDEVRSLPMKLSPPRRTAWILRGFGKSIHEIAEVLHVEDGTVKSTLHAAMVAMRPRATALLAKYENADEPPPEEWEPAMHITTRADKEEMVGQIEEKHGPMSAEDRAEIIEPRPLVDVPHIPVRRGSRRRRRGAKRPTQRKPTKADESRRKPTKADESRRSVTPRGAERLVRAA